jgi:hypothetical protein
MRNQSALRADRREKGLIQFNTSPDAYDPACAEISAA